MNKVKNSEQPKAAPAYQNRVTLVGFLGDKPTQHENRAILSLATKTSWKAKDSDEWHSITEWHRVIAWDELAKSLGSFAKGDHVIVEGELRSNSYDREAPVIGGGTAIVPMKTWEIRARAIRKLVRAKQPAQKPAKTLKAAA